VPEFLGTLGDHLAEEGKLLSEELEGLKKNVEHIRDVITRQQNYAKLSGVAEIVSPTELVEDAIRMNAVSLERGRVQIVRAYGAGLPQINLEKNKVLQILVNLLRNALCACEESGATEKRIVLRVNNGGDHVRIAVIDNGVGITPENLERVFVHGFTTRKNGHGFGLHSSLAVAKEMGGRLMAQSDGIEKGATFTLELPLQSGPVERSAEIYGPRTPPA
jgi:signal transduction histidine kinase